MASNRTLALYTPISAFWALSNSASHRRSSLDHSSIGKYIRHTSRRSIILSISKPSTNRVFSNAVTICPLSWPFSLRTILITKSSDINGIMFFIVYGLL